MSNFSSEVSRRQRLRFWRVVVIVPGVFLILGVVRPLSAKLAHDPPAPVQSSAANPADSSMNSGISGQIVDSATGSPISGDQVIVALEQPDGTGTDTVFTQTSPNAAGNFSFSLLPLNTTFDLVAVAINGSGVTYDATVILGIPSSGIRLGAIPLIEEAGASSGPARIVGTVTAGSASGPSTVRVTISAIQTIGLRGGLSVTADVPQTVTITGSDQRPITIPGGRGTSANIFLRSASDCSASMANVNCGKYVIVVPGGNPSVGFFSAGKISYQQPSAAPAVYSVRANAFVPHGSGGSVCLPSFQSVNADAQGGPLKLSPGETATAQPISFSGCW